MYMFQYTHRCNKHISKWGWLFERWHELSCWINMGVVCMCNVYACAYLCVYEWLGKTNDSEKAFEIKSYVCRGLSLEWWRQKRKYAQTFLGGMRKCNFEIFRIWYLFEVCKRSSSGSKESFINTRICYLFLGQGLKFFLHCKFLVCPHLIPLKWLFSAF